MGLIIKNDTRRLMAFSLYLCAAACFALECVLKVSWFLSEALARHDWIACRVPNMPLHYCVLALVAWSPRGPFIDIRNGISPLVPIYNRLIYYPICTQWTPCVSLSRARKSALVATHLFPIVGQIKTMNQMCKWNKQQMRMEKSNETQQKRGRKKQMNLQE